MKNLAEENLDHKAGKRFRLVVRSAEEAVRVIRDRLGESAKVISVRQVGGEGLKRFISSPKLEVIAEVPASPDPTALTTDSLTEERKNAASAEEPPVREKKNLSLPEIVGRSPNNSSEEEDSKVKNDKISLLKKAGFDEGLLSEITSWSNWQGVRDESLADALKEITVGLSQRFQSVPSKPTSDRIALIGSPGVGKTTTLCKFLAHEVFMNKKIPHVLKIENGVPNPDDALRIFCEVIGVTLYREPEKIPPVDRRHPLFVDFPGLALNQIDDWINTKNSLDDLGIDTRVLVVNGAYDKTILSKNVRNAEHLGATHLAITHFDELSNSTKLWPLIMHGNLSPLCICNGQNITGDFTNNVLNQLISRTFPEELYAKGFSSYQRH